MACWVRTDSRDSKVELYEDVVSALEELTRLGGRVVSGAELPNVDFIDKPAAPSLDISEVHRDDNEVFLARLVDHRLGP